MSKKNESLSIFLSGVIVGGILGILYAPDKGVSTRKKLSFKLSKYKEALEDFLDDLVKGKDTPLNTEARSLGEKAVSVAKNKAERLLEDVDELLSQIRGN